MSGLKKPKMERMVVQGATVRPLMYFGAFSAGFGFAAFLAFLWLYSVYDGGLVK